MKRTLLFKFIILLVTLFQSSDCICSNNGNILQCYNTGSFAVDTSLYNLSACNLIDIVYNGSAVLSLTAPSAIPIVIQPFDQSGIHTLRISAINTNAARIDIQINLSLNQISTSLFATSSSIIAPTSILSINVIQSIPDPSNFKVFDTSSSTQMNFPYYELIFNSANTLSGNLSLPYLIYGLKNLTSITISGNNHTLLVNPIQMPPSIYVNQLSLKNLHLHDQILVSNFYNLQVYSIEQCLYEKTSNFLNSSQSYNLALNMINNYPIDSVLPYRSDTFAQLKGLMSLTLIEPRLNSSSLKAIKQLSAPAKVLINLNQYYQTDMVDWATYQPVFWDLTIQNIQNLAIFPPAFFYNFQAIKQVALQGAFALEKSAICIFVGINIQNPATYPIVILNSSMQGPNNWDYCADTYIQDINQKSMNDIICPGGNTYQNCQQWANQTAQCALSTYENTCTGTLQKYANNFFYNTSAFYNFFNLRVWLNSTIYPTRSPIPEGDNINIGAIIGAICGLVAAIVILGITIFCIYRRRQNNTTQYISSTPAEKYKSSSYDPTHVSIATSKSSKSSRYALQKSFFPAMQPNDEIAPPLYTAPSESVGSVSAYNLPSAPAAPRDSISTHATHVYETVDS